MTREPPAADAAEFRRQSETLTRAGTMTKTMTKRLLYMFNMLHMESANEKLQPVDAIVSYCNSAV